MPHQVFQAFVIGGMVAETNSHRAEPVLSRSSGQNAPFWRREKESDAFGRTPDDAPFTAQPCAQESQPLWRDPA